MIEPFASVIIVAAITLRLSHKDGAVRQFWET